MVRFTCPGCRVMLKAPDRHIGAAMPCPKCGRRLFVPGPLPASGRAWRLPLLLGGAGALALAGGLFVALTLIFLPPRHGGDPVVPQPPADQQATNSKGPADGGPRPPSADPADGRKYALLVGVRNYKKGELRSLKYTENDADALAGVLRDAGYKRVVEMTQGEAQRDADLQPTARNIRGQLRALLEDRRPEDAVLVAFSGHGVQFKDDKGSYFCPMDAELADRTTLVSLAEVYRNLEGCPAGLRVLLVDACRADPQPSNKGPAKVDLDSVTRPQAERPPGGVAALFSCSEGQFSYESDDLKHGVFFHFLIEGLKGKAVNKRGEVTLERLASYVKDEVPDRVKDQEGPQARQVPHLVGDLSGSSALVQLDSTGRGPPAQPEEKPRPPVTKEEKPTPPVTKEEKPEEDITNTIGMKLKLIKPGKFLMGWSPKDEESQVPEEGPQHEVEITKAYYMGVNPVTKGQFAAFAKAAPYTTEAETGGKGFGYNASTKKFESGKYSWRDPGFVQTDEHPVVEVSWNDAKAFCDWLSKKEGKTYELPTEAEWEYACRAGTKTRFWCGDADASLKGNANIADASLKEKDPDVRRVVAWNDDYPFTSPVGSFKANAWGLYDMHGNVWQWCIDWYGPYESRYIKDQHSKDSGNRRVLRGGSWRYDPRFCPSASRGSGDPADRFDDYGFRVVLRLPPGTP